jgi:DNA polymerase III alpha subunit
MQVDDFGVVHFTTNEVADLLYINPDMDLSKLMFDDVEQFNTSNQETFAGFPKLGKYTRSTATSVEEFDTINQNSWKMPEEYVNIDIAEHILGMCKTDAELQRVGEELLMFQERELFPLLKFLKYFVDTMRKYNVVWGVGRGSSVASYVLYLLGVHKIDSMYYDLDITEFLK